MIKWKVITKKQSDLSSLIKTISITITSEDTNKEEYRNELSSIKSKSSFTPKKEGVFRICVHFNGKNQPVNDPLYINLRFGSDNMDEPDIQKALKEKDISEIQKKMKTVVDLGKPIIDRQKQEIYHENENAEQTLQSTKW